MPHELLLQKLQQLKELIEKEREITAKNGWTHMMKMRGQERIDNAIIDIQETIQEVAVQ